LIFFLLYTKNR